MEDSNVLKHIENLVAEEDRLHEAPNLSEAEVQRLHKIKTELDQYWDFLRQRRALRDAGKSPDAAQMRSSDTIQNYEE